ncbi:hypothetical protein ECANGB1_893 [Enterospora canceri]|uniref:Uncharacterized protein n=1 Tax=Enterospora canceri TaxID=1081671 RepID=A0A1Y1S788_9MICR|nr:hypothetical protein ECANGB1_893 [Enterospora canceri]
MKALQQLKEHILKKKYPIVLQGPPGTNKLSTTINMLQKYNIKYKQIDISEIRYQHKPLIPCIYIIQNIENSDVLDKITYFKNLIVISDVFVSRKRHEVTLITVTPQSFPGKTRKELATTKELLEDENTLSIFRLAGKIFHKKCTGKQIDYQNSKFIYYFNNSSKEVKEVHETDTVQSKTKDRRKIIEESTDSFDLETATLPLQQEKLAPDKFSKSFSASAMQDVFYANFHNFVDMNNIVDFYDILSLTDIQQHQQITFALFASQKGAVCKKFIQFTRNKFNKPE